MADALEPLVADGVIEEVISRLKSGKEADIYLVQHAGEIVAAKVYKERTARNFHNNAQYLEGRRNRSSRTQRAIDKGSRFGQAAAEEAWKATESDVLHQLYAAGVRVPQPVLFYEGVLLMEAVIDPEGHPAPRLIDAPIQPERAADLYADLRSQAIRILTLDLIHGDLSPYNVLLAWNGPTIIDFPQAVGAAHNQQAEFFFTRDLENIRRFFATLDPTLNTRSGDAWEIWRAYQRRELTPDFVPSGKAQPGPRREFIPGARGGGGGQGPRQRGHGGGGRPGHEGGAPKHEQRGHGGGGRAGHDGGAPKHEQRGHGGGGGRPGHEGGPPSHGHRGHGGPRTGHEGGGPKQEHRSPGGGSPGNDSRGPRHEPRGQSGRPRGHHEPSGSGPGGRPPSGDGQGPGGDDRPRSPGRRRRRRRH